MTRYLPYLSTGMALAVLVLMTASDPGHEAASASTGRPPSCRRVHSLERDGGGVSLDRAAIARLERVGRTLAPKVQELPVSCRFRLLKSPARNAYSFSCGCLYITRGLYRELDSDSLLAAILAHEMGHVVAQDGKRPCSDGVCQLEREIAADRKAAAYLRRTRYSPQALRRAILLLRQEQPDGWAERRLAALDPLLPRTPETRPEG